MKPPLTSLLLPYLPEARSNTTMVRLKPGLPKSFRKPPNLFQYHYVRLKQGKRFPFNIFGLRKGVIDP